MRQDPSPTATTAKPRHDRSAGTARAPARRLSCGTVLLNSQRELLLCHVTGQRHWDLPKGGIDAGETELEAALRETCEETGLALNGASLVDLGAFVYTPKKNLHLYAALIERVDTRTLHCATHFVDRATGRELPEMDGFGWFAFDRVAALCTANMAALLNDRIGLDALFMRLVPPAAPRSA